MERAADVAGVALGYCLGSVPVGLWMGRFRRGLDVREHGSGSTGSTNMLRIVGPGAAAATFALDVGKGAAAVALARSFGATEAGQVGAGLAAMVGHSWPALANFRGGKSVATAFGGLLVLSPGAGPWAVAGGISALATTRTVSIGSLTATTVATAATAVEAVRGGNAGPFVFMGVAAALIVVRHQENLVRLSRGEEPRLSLSRFRGKKTS